ncbi:MAG TPA: DUF5678 domain-containing protein [Blastocatellia bacterium]|nr:DUF5678 domain-containing protein [Blastocatellia bacterium]
MSEITAETLYNQINSLPESEKLKLRELLDAQLRDRSDLSSQAKFVQPIQMPDPEPSRRWMNERAHEYGGRWVALDGNRLIAHGEDAAEVFAAADADGAYLPLVIYIPPADAPPFAGV